MNHVTTLFNSNEFGELRTIIIENEVYFVAKSVATALGYKDTADAIRKHIDEEDKLRWQIADTGQKRETYLINESGLYSLILKSMFVKGARAQGKLWEEELADDAAEGETFHINDLVQEGEADD